LIFALSCVAIFATQESAAQYPIRAIQEIYPDSIVYRTFCKQNFLFKVAAPLESVRVEKVATKEIKRPLLTIHGNVRYDFLYRSFVDTPFAQKDFKQHTIQTALNITVRDKYPLRLSLATRISNSPYFKNFLDANLLFDRLAYLRQYKQQLLDRISQKQYELSDLGMLEEAVAEQLKKLEALKEKLQQPDISEKLIREKEAAYNKGRGLTDRKMAAEDSAKAMLQAINDKITHQDLDSLKNVVLNKADSTTGKYAEYIKDKQKELDSLQKGIERLKKKKDSIQGLLSKKIATARQQINKARHPGELDKLANENGLTERHKKGIEGILGGIRSIGIGRSVINYSELTAMNVSLTGLTVEYNPKIYAALAIGKIDYGFRDFFGKNTLQKSQQLLMGRIGWGDKDRRAIILSVFTGRKYNYGSALSDTVSNQINLVGYSIEGILKKNENTGISVEVAKSTGPASGRLKENQEINRLVKFNDRSNLAVSLKGQTLIRPSQTRISGFYRRSGERFQSFSLFTYNTDQTAWLVRADQPFLRNRVSVTAMLRRNDFTNPFTEKTFKTSTVFKSIQLNARFPRWPSLSLGYYPGSQLYLIDKERIRETAYYIVNGTLIYTYRLGGLKMLSSAIYNRYDSKGTDSGFITYKGINYLLSHSFLISKLQLQGAFSYTDQPEMHFYTMEATGEYAAARILKIGAGLKYNKVTDGNIYWGGRAHLLFDTGKPGALQLQYEKSFLPTIYKTLFPVETGRLSWIKNF